VPKLLTNNFSSTQGASESSGGKFDQACVHPAKSCTIRWFSPCFARESSVQMSPAMAQELFLLIKGKRDLLKLNLLERNPCTCPLISLDFATSD